MGEWRIEPLGREHDRVAFCCGKSLLDDFLRSLVSQYEKRNLGRTYVEVHALDSQARGFYERYGFVPLLDNELHLYLPIKTLQDGLGP